MVDRVREGYKKTEVGVIPEDWEVLEIQEAYDICNNLRLPISEHVRKSMQGNYPYYGPTKIQDYINEYRLDGEYALIGEDGDHFLKWYTMPMTLLAIGKFNVNNHAHVVKGINNQTKWFYWYFNQKDITPVLSRQGAGRYKLNKATLKTIKMPIPSLLEQTVISEVLSDVDSLISSIEKLIAKKQSIKQGAMQELLMGKRRLIGCCDELVLGKLADVIDTIVGGGTPSRANDSYWGGNIPWVTVKDFSTFNAFYAQESITELGLKNSATHLVKKGAVIIATRMALGKAVIYKVDVSINQDLKAIVPKANTDSRFLYYWFEKNSSVIDNLGGGSTVKGITLSQLISIPFILFVLEEQNAIAKILCDMDEEIEKLNTKLNKYKAIKQGMMQELLTGKRRLV